MTASLIAIAVVMLASAIAAMTRRNLVHSALFLVLTWGAIAGFYLWCDAEFAAFAQLLVYVGAVSMVVLFAIVLTRVAPGKAEAPAAPFSRILGALVAGGAVAGVLFGAVFASDLPEAIARPAAPTVRQLGLQLMGGHAAALIIVGVILTVALLGALVLADHGRPAENPGSE